MNNTKIYNYFAIFDYNTNIFRIFSVVHIGNMYYFCKKIDILFI